MQIVPYSIEGYKLLLLGQKAFSDIQTNGIRIDMDYVINTYADLEKKIEKQKKKLFSHKEIKRWKKVYGSKFNFNSGLQLSKILYEEFGYTPTKLTEKEKPSTDADALKGLKLPFTEDYILLKQLEKLQGTYIQGLLTETVDGYLHPFLDLHTTVTFRSSGSLPNPQNIPIRDPMMGETIRRAFIARSNHYFTETDYGSIEVKMAAMYHRDPTMLGYLRDTKNSDMHADFFKLLFNMDKYDSKCKGDSFLRKATKNCFTFPQFYGDYYVNNARAFWQWLGFEDKIQDSGVILSNGKTVGKQLISTGIKTYKQFEEHVAVIEKDMWEKRFPVYTQWKKDQFKKYLKQGYITSLSGFTFQGVLKKNEVVNYPIQSLAFHSLLWSCIRLMKLLRKHKMKTKVIFQIHDSLIADVAKNEKAAYYELLQQVMVHDLKEHWKFIDIPIEIDASSSPLNGNWYEVKTELNYLA